MERNRETRMVHRRHRGRTRSESGKLTSSKLSETMQWPPVWSNALLKAIWLPLDHVTKRGLNLLRAYFFGRQASTTYDSSRCVPR
jgi:hypothetical protein